MCYFSMRPRTIEEEHGETCNGEAVNLVNYDDFSESNAPYTMPKGMILFIQIRPSIKFIRGNKCIEKT